MSHRPHFATRGMHAFSEAVDAECQRILEKFGDQHHPMGTGSVISKEIAEFSKLLCQRLAAEGNVTWRHILTEEFREAMAEDNAAGLYQELIQVAAVCFMMIIDLPRHRELGGEDDGEEADALDTP